MKKYFILFALVICVVLVEAQPKLARILTQDYRNSAWKDTTDEVYQYYSNGALMTTVSNGLWASTVTPRTKDSNTYNSSGQLENTFIFDWNTSGWHTIPGTTVTYSYNSSGKKIKSERMSWRVYADTFIYNSGGQLITMITIEATSSGKDSTQKFEYTYVSGELTEKKEFRWDKNSSTWKSPVITSYTYTAGVLTEELAENLGGPNTKLKTQYSYNTNGTLAEKLLLSWDIPAGAYENHLKEIYFYTTATGMNSVNKPNLAVYPNPSAGIYTVDHDELNDGFIKIFDLSGRLVHSQHSGPGETQINLQHVDNGVYLLQIQSTEGVETQKIIKE